MGVGKVTIGRLSIFEMTIDPAKSTVPFASIAGISDFAKKGEILFSMHTVFRIHDIKSMDKIDCLFQVNLTLTSDDDNKDLCTLTNRVREETYPNRL